MPLMLQFAHTLTLTGMVNKHKLTALLYRFKQLPRKKKYIEA